MKVKQEEHQEGENLTYLQNLDLQDNDIEDASPLFTLLKNHLVIEEVSFFKGLFLENNPLENPPQVILKQGYGAVIDWFAQLEKGGAALFESKIMLLGQGGAGKTTLTNLLLDNKYQVEEGKEESTLGISIHKNRVFPHTSNNGIKIKGHWFNISAFQHFNICITTQISTFQHSTLEGAQTCECLQCCQQSHVPGEMLKVVIFNMLKC